MNKIKHERQRLVDLLETLEPLSDDYKTIQERLTKLNEIKKPFNISGDAIVTGLFSVGSTLLVLQFEKLGIITSKAFRPPKY